ncbi:MAG: hypothetical protein J0H68_00355 [Sphingobacteriia bacterium]|nr:hypothetical protein [Sphingobacteriia bacterium]
MLGNYRYIVEPASSNSVLQPLDSLDKIINKLQNYFSSSDVDYNEFKQVFDYFFEHLSSNITSENKSLLSDFVVNNFNAISNPKGYFFYSLCKHHEVNLGFKESLIDKPKQYHLLFQIFSFAENRLSEEQINHMTNLLLSNYKSIVYGENYAKFFSTNFAFYDLASLLKILEPGKVLNSVIKFLENEIESKLVHTVLPEKYFIIFTHYKSGKLFNISDLQDCEYKLDAINERLKLKKNKLSDSAILDLLPEDVEKLRIGQGCDYDLFIYLRFKHAVISNSLHKQGIPINLDSYWQNKLQDLYNLVMLGYSTELGEVPIDVNLLLGCYKDYKNSNTTEISFLCKTPILNAKPLLDGYIMINKDSESLAFCWWNRINNVNNNILESSRGMEENNRRLTQDDLTLINAVHEVMEKSLCLK